MCPSFTNFAHRSLLLIFVVFVWLWLVLICYERTVLLTAWLLVAGVDLVRDNNTAG